MAINVIIHQNHSDGIFQFTIVSFNWLTAAQTFLGKEGRPQSPSLPIHHLQNFRRPSLDRSRYETSKWREMCFEKKQKQELKAEKLTNSILYSILFYNRRSKNKFQNMK
jgi:hypothetical protein